MLQQYRAVYRGGEGEYIEKKSRFIATVEPIDTEEDALEYIEGLRKRYWDARHNCYAFVIGEGMRIQRFSDDGEPGGTAGKPILDVLLGEEIHNVLIVVTRYFGGTLLGTGGLVRAYGRAARDGLQNSIIITKEHGFIILVKTDYNGIGKIQYLLAQRGYHILKSEYTQEVVLEVLVPLPQIEELQQAINEVTAARAVFQKKKEVYFATEQSRPLVFDI